MPGRCALASSERPIQLAEMEGRRSRPGNNLRRSLEAIRNLERKELSRIVDWGDMTVLGAHSEIEQMRGAQKSAVFFRHFLPLRTHLVALLATSYRRYFKVALAQPSQTGGDPDNWAWNQLQPAIDAAWEWMRDWNIAACDGENQRLRRVASVQFIPGQNKSSIPIPTTTATFPLTPWRAPAWLFGISLPLFGIGIMKRQHVPNTDSEERLGDAHTRLLLRGARRVFLWNLREVVERVQNEEIAAAGAIPSEALREPTRLPINRKGWAQREKLYRAIRDTLTRDPNLQGVKFCADLDKRHAPPLFDWMESGQWQEGLTWKEAWGNQNLRRKIRRVRQEAMKRPPGKLPSPTRILN